jgi:DNA-binding MarR family transcriptional regulator
MNTTLGLEDRVLVALRRIVRSIELHSHRLMEQQGLTVPQLITLKVANNLGQVAGSVLAKNVHVSHPTMTGILDRLENHNLVTRVRDSRDRRRVSIKMTKKGLAVLDETPSPLQEGFRKEFVGLDDWEQSQMLSILQRVAAMMEADDNGDSPAPKVGKG